jgi:hypothetical protein
VRLHPAYLLSDVLFQIIKGMEVRRSAERRSHLLRQLPFKFIFTNLQQSTVRVVDDDEFLGVEQVMRND